MSELQFPKNPVVGQQYDFPPYRYYWDGAKWKTMGIGYNPVNDLRDELEPRIETSENKIEDLSAQSFEALRRSYAEAGFTLVDGSFEEGGTLTIATDVLLHRAPGVAYSWGGTLPITVAPNSTLTPLGADGWIDRTDIVLCQQLADASGSELVGFKQSDSGASTRTVFEKLSDTISISDFGASVDGATDDSAAVTAMASAVGYVRFPRGGTALNSITISVPVHFDPGAYIISLTAQTVTIQAAVNAGRQWIFRGDGAYSLEHSGTIGEEARFAHVSWFGAFPGDPAVDCGPLFQKLTNSMGTVREAWIALDTGTYYQQTKTTWQRASKVRGNGSRLTNIWAKGPLASSGDVWVTAATGCDFADLQWNADAVRTSGAYLRLLYSRSYARNMQMDKGHLGVVLEGYECHAENIKGLTWNSAINSRLIAIQGDDCTADTIDFTNSATDCPEAVVGVSATTKTINRPRVSNVRGQTTQHSVYFLVGDGFAINNPAFDGIAMRSCSNGVRGRLVGSGQVTDISVDGVNVGSGAATAVQITMEGTGHLDGGVIGGLVGHSLTDTGVKIEAQSTGVAKKLSIGDHSLGANNNGVYVAGAGSAHEDITIAPGVVYGGTDGYEVKAVGVSIVGTIASQCTNGYRVVPGSDEILINAVYRGDGTALIDGSGGATKSITVL